MEVSLYDNNSCWYIGCDLLLLVELELKTMSRKLHFYRN